MNRRSMNLAKQLGKIEQEALGAEEELERDVFGGRKSPLLIAALATILAREKKDEFKAWIEAKKDFLSATRRDAEVRILIYSLRQLHVYRVSMQTVVRFCAHSTLSCYCHSCRLSSDCRVRYKLSTACHGSKIECRKFNEPQLERLCDNGHCRIRD
jgi:hypothetical protein